MFSVSSLLRMDQTLFSLVNIVWTNPGLDRLMATLSCLDAWMPLLLVAILGIAVAGCFKSRAMLLVLLVTVGLTDGVVVNGLKHWVNRPRPNQVEEARVVDLQKTNLKVLRCTAVLRKQG